MRKLKLSLAIIAIIGIITACKKNDTSSPLLSATNVEAWVGTWQFSNGSNSKFLSLHFHDNGRLLVQISRYIDPYFPGDIGVGIGNWRQQGDSIKASFEIEVDVNFLDEDPGDTYSDSIYSFSFKKSSSTQAMGTIGTKNSTSGFGNFTLEKPNTPGIIGSWVGKYSLNNGAQNLPYILHFNQIIRQIDGQPERGVIVESLDSTNPNKINIVLGEWQLIGDSVKANFANATSNFTIIGNYNSTTPSITMNGTFGKGIKTTGLGSFQVQKK